MLKKGDADSSGIGMTNRLIKHEQNGPITISSSAVSISHKNIRDSRDFDLENNSITKIARNNLNVMLVFLIFFPIMRLREVVQRVELVERAGDLPHALQVLRRVQGLYSI